MISRITAASLVLAAATAATGLDAIATAQPIDVERPRTLVVGTPPGARLDRVTPGRTGRDATSLPTDGIRSEWRVALGVLVDQAPLVDARGVTRVLGVRGEVITVSQEGVELSRVATAGAQPGPGALLSDDTLVFADAAGEAVAVRDGAVRWKVKFGRSDATRPAPLPLEDGGVVVATAHDLAVLDADGRERARTTLTEDAAGPLVATGRAVTVAGSTGSVWRWELGAAAPVRIGGFGSGTEGGVVLASDGALLAVTSGGARLSALDPARGSAVTRALASPGMWLGPPVVHGAATTVDLLVPGGELAVTVDAAGAETGRVLLQARAPSLSPDGGLPPLVAVAHAPLLVDGSGTLAFATADGSVGIAARGAAETLAGICPAVARARPDEPSGAAGLAPLGPGAFVAVCHSGLLVAVRGRAGERSGGGL